MLIVLALTPRPAKVPMFFHSELSYSMVSAGLETLQHPGLYIEPLPGHDAAEGWQLTSHPLPCHSMYHWHPLRAVTLWKAEVFMPQIVFSKMFTVRLISCFSSVVEPLQLSFPAQVS